MRQPVIHMERLRRIRDRHHADLLRQPDRGHVHGELQRRLHGDRWPERPGRVLRLPKRVANLDAQFGVGNHLVRRNSRLQSGQIDHRFDARTRLPHRLTSPIELALIETKATHHRENAPGDRIHANQRALHAGNLPQ